MPGDFIKTFLINGTFNKHRINMLEKSFKGVLKRAAEEMRRPAYPGNAACLFKLPEHCMGALFGQHCENLSFGQT